MKGARRFAPVVITHNGHCERSEAISTREWGIASPQKARLAMTARDVGNHHFAPALTASPKAGRFRGMAIEDLLPQVES
jgi:hypothetical protein